MRYLWDTHALIWGLENDPQLSAEARDLAAQPGNAISSISLWEVACLHHLKRISLAIPVEDWLAVAAEKLQVIPISPQIAAASYALGPFHGDPADRLIAATSLVCTLKLVTRDRRLLQCARLDCLRA